VIWLQKLWFLGLAALGFVGDQCWRLHLERGQYYVFISFLLMLVFVDVLANRERVLTAICLGAAIAFRPTIGLISLLLTDLGIERDFGPALHQSMTAEGVEWMPHLEAYSGNVSFYWFFSHVLAERRGPQLVSKFAYEPLRIWLLSGTLVTACAVAWWLRRLHLRPRWILTFIMLATLSADFLIAPERNSYSDLMLLPLIALVVPLCTRVRALAPAGTTIIASSLVASSHIGFTRLCEIQNAGPLANWSRNVGVFLGSLIAVLFAVWIARTSNRSGLSPPATLTPPLS
jgi:hypothetical protein